MINLAVAELRDNEIRCQIVLFAELFLTRMRDIVHTRVARRSVVIRHILSGDGRTKLCGLSEL